MDDKHQNIAILICKQLIHPVMNIKFLTPTAEQCSVASLPASQPVMSIRFQIAISSVLDRSYLANLGISGPGAPGNPTSIMLVDPGGLKEFNCI